jgi:hypothetical protein
MCVGDGVMVRGVNPALQRGDRTALWRHTSGTMWTVCEGSSVRLASWPVNRATYAL